MTCPQRCFRHSLSLFFFLRDNLIKIIWPLFCYKVNGAIYDEIRDGTQTFDEAVTQDTVSSQCVTLLHIDLSSEKLISMNEKILENRGK
jgi:hypothetical protein